VININTLFYKTTLNIYLLTNLLHFINISNKNLGGIMKKIFIFLLSITFAFSQAALFHKVLLKNPDALCLDGSPGAYYISKGTSPEKIIVYFEGGGWCGAKDLATTLESCYQRSKGGLGSSKNYSDTVSFSEGFLSNNANNKFR
jgi:hypothetical protein